MRKVVKIYVILIISIIALYYIVIFTFILWPNKLKSSSSVIQNELSVTHPNGTGQIEVLEKLNTFGPVVFRTKDEGVISAKNWFLRHA